MRIRLAVAFASALAWPRPSVSQKPLATSLTEPAMLASLLQQPPLAFGPALPEVIVRHAADFLTQHQASTEFAGKTPLAAQPVYAHGVDGVAYYEVWLTRNGLTPEGWLLLSATERDYPLVNFSHNGTPYSLKVRAKAAKHRRVLTPTDRFYRFGASYFTLESRAGDLIAEHGQMPSWLPVPNGAGGGGYLDSKGQDTIVPSASAERAEVMQIRDYAELRRVFAAHYFRHERAQVAKAMQSRFFAGHGLGQGASPAGYLYRYIDSYSNQALYTQIPANYGWNWTDCWSGCNNNAWAGIYAWWDKNQGKGYLIGTTTTGETCPTYRNTTARQAVVDLAQMILRNYCDTYCGSGTGWTNWSDAYKGYKYAVSQGYGYACRYWWCSSAGCNVNIANVLVECVGNDNRPAHVGANSHFYIATGLAQWDTNTDWTWVYCYPGWDEDHSDDVWISWHDIHSSTRVYVY